MRACNWWLIRWKDVREVLKGRLSKAPHLAIEDNNLESGRIDAASLDIVAAEESTTETEGSESRVIISSVAKVFLNSLTSVPLME